MKKDIKNGIIYFLLGIITLCFISCKQKENKSKIIKFVLIEKPILGDQYYLKSKHTILCVNPNDYIRYNIKDTIVFKVYTEGFWKGIYYLNK